MEEIKMNYKEVADKIVEFSGGKENLKEGMHCFTRIRLYLVDPSKADIKKIEAIEGIVGTQFQNGQLQVIVGNDVGKVFAHLEQYLDKPTSENEKDDKDSSILDKLMTTVSNVFTPILPAIIGAGLMKGILPLLVMLNLITENGGTYNVLNIVADTSFYFLPFLIAISASKRFKVNEYLGIALAGSLLYPTMLNAEATLNLFDIVDIPHVNYSATVIPIILGVWVMSYVYRAIDKVIPNTVKMIFTPLLTLIIMIPLLLSVFGPLGSYVGTYLAEASVWIGNEVPALYGIIIGGLYPLIIMTGMHYAFFPIMLENVARLGFENGFLPVGLFANLAMAGSTFAVAIWARNKQKKEVAYSSAISAVFGITEPALYGVALKMKKPLYATMIAGGIVSAVTLTLGVKMFSFVAPGILSLAVFVSPDGSMNNFAIAIVGIIISFGLAFILTSLFIRKDRGEVSEKQNQTISNNNKTIDIYAPISGKTVPLANVPDTTFSDGLVGKGIAIIPDRKEHEIKAAFDGVITMLTPTNHAIGITSDDGVELLIHIGIETVNLKGEGFHLKVKEGQRIKKGETLIEFEPEIINQNKMNLITPIIVLNYEKFLDVVHTEEVSVNAQDKLLMVIK